jgi:hypothetical protein
MSQLTFGTDLIIYGLNGSRHAEVAAGAMTLPSTSDALLARQLYLLMVSKYHKLILLLAHVRICSHCASRPFPIERILFFLASSESALFKVG